MAYSDYLQQQSNGVLVAVGGVYVQHIDNVTSTGYIADAATDPQGKYTYTTPPATGNSFSVYWSKTLLPTGPTGWTFTGDAGYNFSSGGGGGASPITTRGDLIDGSPAGVEQRLAIGGAGSFLRSNGTDPSWQAIAEADVTNLATDLAAKAADASVVHLAGTETVTGAKSFSAAAAFNAGLSVKPSALSPALSSGNTINSAATGVARVTPAAPVTSIVLQAGTVSGQEVTVRNEGTAANTITFDTDVTSNVANGVNVVIAGLSECRFTWSASAGLWYAGSQAATGGVLDITAGMNVQIRGSAQHPIIDASEQAVWVPSGWIAETMPRYPGASSATLTPLATGRLYALGVTLPSGTGISFAKLAALSGTTAEAGGTHAWMGLWDLNGNGLFVTADTTGATAWGGNSFLGGSTSGIPNGVAIGFTSRVISTPATSTFTPTTAVDSGLALAGTTTYNGMTVVGFNGTAATFGTITGNNATSVTIASWSNGTPTTHTAWGIWGAASTFTPTYHGAYYFGICVVATTVPSLTGAATNGALVAMSPNLAFLDSHTALLGPTSAPPVLDLTSGGSGGAFYGLVG